jgi:oligoribonuclease
MRTLQYVVLDFEATGLDPVLDEVIEVAVIGADLELNEMFRFQSCVQTSERGMQRLVNLPPVLKMHSANGLLDIVREGAENGVPLPTLAEVEASLVNLIDPLRHQYPDGRYKKVTLSGSGVSHYDDLFVQAQMPHLSSRLERGTFDVGSFRRQYERWNGFDLTDANDFKTHRAMDDVECHLDEMRDFRDVFVSHGRNHSTHHFAGATS